MATAAAEAAPARPLLSLHDLHVYLGQSHVLQGVTFDVPEGGVTALLGRNGVGKTTTVRAILGLVGRRGAAVDDVGRGVLRHIVEDGGHVEARGQPGSGAVFIVRLPLARRPASDAPRSL